MLSPVDIVDDVTVEDINRFEKEFFTYFETKARKRSRRSQRKGADSGSRGIVEEAYRRI
jgi:hypothetical protein